MQRSRTAGGAIMLTEMEAYGRIFGLDTARLARLIRVIDEVILSASEGSK